MTVSDARPTGGEPCYACRMWASDDRPVREEIVLEEPWRVAHSFGTSLPGWLVLLPRRHVLGLHELTTEEMAPVGPLLQRLSAALKDVTGCEKTYVMLFGEAQGFGHVHFHVVPRMPWFTQEIAGPNIFKFLLESPERWVSPEEMDRVGLRVRAALGG